METEIVANNQDEHSPEPEEDAIVCFCYRKTTKELKRLYKETGSSLKALEEATNVGLGCGGCRIVLQSLFGETPSDINQVDQADIVGSSCVKPGSRTMKGFVIANEHFESTISSSNCVAPQLGQCDSTTKLEYALVDHRGEPVVHKKKTVSTNETFIFRTEEEDLKRPFYGIFMLTFDRSNYGASRFNIHWRSKNCSTSTHENATTGRPRITLPFIVTKEFLDSCNDIYLALMNPHPKANPFTLTVSEVDTLKEYVWHSTLGPMQSTWINANKFLFAHALTENPEGRFAVRTETDTLEQHGAITVYFFFHNRELDLWSSNHL